VDPEGALDLQGVARSAVGMVQRPDGSSQLTIAGWPVYRYAGDTTPGATGGQGVGGTWFAFTPVGGKAG
jgi:predicted lipoprotein with Yx(FWY)xxD motif